MSINFNRIDDAIYKQIKESIPIPCVDILVKSDSGLILLLKRENEPLKGEWFTPGGRVLKNEERYNAVKRILYDETSISTEWNYLIKELKTYDFMAETTDELFHCISTAYRIIVDNKWIDNVILDEQNSEYRWFKEKEWYSFVRLHPMIIDIFKYI